MMYVHTRADRRRFRGDHAPCRRRKSEAHALDGTYLGHPYQPVDLNSVSNQFGRYGNQFSPDSINNQFGKYGNP